MSLVILKRYNNVGEALVAYSSLKAAGFNPSFHNFHHAHIAYLQMLAFGGLIVLIPEQEYRETVEFIQHVQTIEPLDYDPIPVEKYGRWKSTLLFSLESVGISAFMIALYIFIRSKFLLLLGMLLGVLIVLSKGPIAELFTLLILFLFPVAILLHAEYVAIPRLKRNQADEP